MRTQFIPLLTVPWSHRVELTFSNEALLSLRGTDRLADPSRLVFTRFIRPLATGLGLGIGAAHTFVEQGHDARPHAHCLLVGRNIKTGKTLDSFTINQIAKHWPYGIAHVQLVDNVEKAVGYLERNCRQGRDSFNLSGLNVLGEWMPCGRPTASQAPQRRSTQKEASPPWA